MLSILCVTQGPQSSEAAILGPGSRADDGRPKDGRSSVGRLLDDLKLRSELF